ncbi:MAG TPA: RecX family transcriptional regulator [Gaiellaceae bacterium]|jgi:regulatory protein|nr:RecX family transcriptional regulator [Gaiellaceae bacterium]
MAAEPPRALEVATRALARRDFSERGLRERLRRSGISQADEDKTLRALQRAGIVDDSRFARSRAQALAERGQGDAAIRFDLRRQGIAEDEIETAVASLEPERARAERVVARRGAGAATARLLARRGFDEDAVEAAVAPDA